MLPLRQLLFFEHQIMKHIFALLLFVPLFNFSQVNDGLSPDERAYLFHIVKKSPILDNSIGRYFDYKGPLIQFFNKEINYDSVELIIINQPELLLIRKAEIAKSPKGIIAEAANKMALWELNKVLLAKRGSDKDLEPYLAKYTQFEQLIIQQLPPNALKEKDGTSKLHPKIGSILNPSLSLDDKVALLESFRFLDPNDCLLTMNAINAATNSYVQKRTIEIYKALGGETTVFQNVLVAAGDGSSTSGLLEEREKDERGRWNRGLPKAVGLFPYQLRLTEAKPKKDPTVESLIFTTNDFSTVGNNRITDLHFDVWGYNSKKQTTVVIEKNGLNYHLFGAGDTRFLSPDSAFSAGATFKSIIDDLEKNKIGKLDEMIFGKKGFDHWIEYNKKKKDDTELKIEINEKKYSDLSMRTISTSSKPSRAVRRARKKSLKTGGGPVDYQPTTSSSKKEKRKSQNEIVSLYNTYENYKKKIAELEKQRQEAIDLKAIYQTRLDGYKRNFGYTWADYTEKDGLYTFQDSSTFDLYTQEFHFPATPKAESFEVRLIAVPESSISDQADEVMLHISLIDASPNYNARLQVELNDVFQSDGWQLERKLFSQKDSVALMQFFEGLLDKKVAFSVTARGQGIGSWNGCRTVKNTAPVELNSYPGSTTEQRNASRMDSTYMRLRKSELFIHLGRSINVEINSFTDPVISNLAITKETILATMARYKLSKNDVLSAYRTATLLNKLKDEINVYAGTYLTREQAKLVIDRFNKEFDKARVAVGQTSIKLVELK
jgi:hypothetical protein